LNILQDIIYPAADEVSASMTPPNVLEKSPQTILMGNGSLLDSLGVVSFIVAVEGRIVEETGQALTLASEKAMSRKHSPFRTFQTLSDYIAELLEDVKHG